MNSDINATEIPLEPAAMISPSARLTRSTSSLIPDGLDVDLTGDLSRSGSVQGLDCINSSKVFNDPVHGHIELAEVCMQVIDTPQFQRLRELKQTGAACFVFPGATHTRFEHSIGVCHLANEMVQHLRSKQPDLGITDNDVKCVGLAGLCHDLGHGPFSHLFDSGIVASTRPDLNWSHEQGSEDMLEYLVRDNPVSINAEELQFIKDLIHGAPRGTYPQSKKTYLYEIVANQRNSVDVDKFDYIQRDTLHIGLKSSLDAGRLIKFSRVVDGQICYHQKEAMNLCELFHTRYSLFKRVYTHKVSAAIEYMIMDALIAADHHLKLTSAIHDMPRYLYMDDSVLGEIERSTSPELQVSRNILLRMRKRDLYRLADQVIVPHLLQKRLTKLHISSESIVKCNSENFSSSSSLSQHNLVPSDIIVQWLKLNYATKDRHPLESIRFYRKYGNNESLALRKDQVSAFIPDHYQELTIRVYSRCYEKSGYIQRAFRQLLVQLNKEFDQNDPLHGTETEMTVDSGEMSEKLSSVPSSMPLYSNSLPVELDSGASAGLFKDMTMSDAQYQSDCSDSTYPESLIARSVGNHRENSPTLELVPDPSLSIPTNFGTSSSPYKRPRRSLLRSNMKRTG
ncbi:hypothetical protein BASA83_001457 [Batrachochytrium salamandrivorans]|nr:hypothetical protein BASA83_001457 [Batrachochytrium salamandrivorans]